MLWVDEKLDKNKWISNFFAEESFLQVKVAVEAQLKEGPTSDSLLTWDPEGPRELPGSSGIEEACFVPLDGAISKPIPHLRFCVGIIHSILTNVCSHDICGKASLILNNDANMIQ